MDQPTRNQILLRPMGKNSKILSRNTANIGLGGRNRSSASIPALFQDLKLDIPLYKFSVKWARI
jgi:hypothetical protein